MRILSEISEKIPGQEDLRRYIAEINLAFLPWFHPKDQAVKL